jgi:cytochrome c oxidase subunit 3
MFRFGVLVTFVCISMAADQPSICFRNVAKEAGIDFVLDNGATPEKRMIETMAGGLAFLFLHIYEWMHLIEEGLRPFGIEPGTVFAKEWAEKWPKAPPLFGATFFAITGLHMFHVLTGVLYLAVIAMRVRRMKHEDVEISGLYWHFVDLVWMFVFPLIYIMSVNPTG